MGLRSKGQTRDLNSRCYVTRLGGSINVIVLTRYTIGYYIKV